MGKTKIQWTDYSWPVINGCMRKSAGCENCYAERLTATRLSKTPKYGGLAVMKSNGPHWTGEVRLHEKSLFDPLRIKKPSRIFVCDMGDLFYEAVPDEWIDQVFAVMLMCPQHTFQVLTKRPDRMLKYFQTSETVWENIAKTESVKGERKDDVLNAAMQLLGPSSSGGRFSDREILERQDDWPLSNVWLGVSCEDQKTADERIPILLETPAALRWISAEPLIAPISFRWAKWQPFLNEPGSVNNEYDGLLRLDWIVCGGESGPGARSLDLAWLKSIVTQCQAAKVPVFVKQLGHRPWWDGVSTRPPADHVYLEAGVVMNGKVGWQFDLMKDRKGGLIDEWPEDLRVREWPERINPLKRGG